MDWITTLTLLLVGILALMALGVPVAVAFITVNIFGAFFLLGGDKGIAQLARNMATSVANFAFTPIPLFVLMGEILFRTGLAIKAIDAVALLINRVPGRLAVIALVAGTIFSAISGSTIATTAMLGSLLLPEMLKRGYDRSIAMGPIMAIGGVDMLIPPSGLAVLLGGLAGIAIADLLIAGIIPGLILSTIFIGYIVLRAWLNPALAPAAEATTLTGWARWKPFTLHVLPLVVIIGLVIGSMVLGWATPTESAAVGCATTAVLAVCYRQLTWKSVKQALSGTAGITGMIMFIILGATTFSQILAFSGATGGIIQLVTEAQMPTMLVIVGMLLILLFLGLFIDQASIMMLTVPLFMPLIIHMKVDTVWFGILFLMCMQIGLLSPPFGLLLFTMKSVAPAEITMSDIINAAMPYIIFGLILTVVILFVPGIATWLPTVLGR
ncbi:MAG: TRAP transporter large permease subunit [Betaproteobacteria bacterium]|nr:TRAP transporter large permease subunit [Betaproteobacteria bacterium]